MNKTYHLEMAIARILLVFCLLLSAVLAPAQEAQLLRERLATVQGPAEAMAVVDEIYQGREVIPDGPKYKHWVRWAWWWSRHVQPDGSFGNPRKQIMRASALWPDVESGQRNSNNSWSPIGPVSSTYANNGTHCRLNGYGRIDRIAFHPTNANTIYAGAPYGGLWRSTNGGSSWISLTDHLPGIGVGGIVVDHQSPSTLYVLSGVVDNTPGSFITLNGYFNVSDGVFKSTTGGVHWENVLTFDDPNIRARHLKQHPSDNQVLFALTGNGIWRTEDAGMSWDSIFAGDYLDIEFHPTDHDTIYISGLADFRYSYDMGDTWSTATGLSFCNNRRAEIEVTADAPDRVWVLAGDGFTNNTPSSDAYCGLFRSTNSGQSFTSINNQPDILAETGSDQSNYDLAMAIHPTNQSNIVVGALSIWRNPNGGIGQANWTNTVPYGEPSPGSQQGTLPANYVHCDIHEMIFNPVDNKLYAGTDGGIYVSADGGINWTNITQGIVTAQIYKINGSLTNAGRLPVGLQDNGVKMRVSSASTNYPHIQSGDGYEAVVDPNNNNVVTASINDRLYLYNTYTSTNRTVIEGNNQASQFFLPVRYRPGSSDSILYGDGPLTVYRVSTGTKNPITGTSASWTIETCPDVPNRVYFAGGANGFQNDPNGSFYTSFNGGSTASDQSTTPGFPSQLQMITDIATYPGQCHKVAFSMGGFLDGAKVYYSQVSGGGSWQNISYNLPNVPVHSIAIDDSGNFYAGTEIGVFVKSESGTEWASFFNGLPRVPVSGLIFQESTNKVIASTFGRGAWEAFQASGCSVASSVTGQLQGQQLYSAELSVTSSALISGGAGTDVTFSAGSYVRLDPGFLATTGNRFIANLDGCIE